MFTTLLAVVIALGAGHAAPRLAAALRDHAWFARWLDAFDRRFPDGDGVWRGRWGISLALLPPLLAVGLVQVALDGRLYGLPALLFGVAALFYAWGPRDLDQDVDDVVEAPDVASRREAAEALWPASAGVHDPGDARSLVGVVFRSALRRWFAVLFWFLLLGPFGAVGYRLLAVAAEGPPSLRLPPETATGGRWLLAVLDWAPAQLMALSLALVGNFDEVVTAWRAAGGAGFTADTHFLAAAGRASVRSELADAAEDVVDEGIPPSSAVVLALGPLPELRDAMSLVWRILLVWLAVLAFFVVAGWVG